MDFIYILRSIIALVFVIWLVNVMLKYLNQYTNKQTKAIEIIERISVSKTSSLAIVKVLSQYYLISFSENSSKMLREFTEEESKAIHKMSNEDVDTESIDFFKKIDLEGLKEKYSNFFNQNG